MKKSLLFIMALAIGLAYSCKKDKPMEPASEERKPEVLIKTLTASLASADSISLFTNALKTMALTAEQTADGITVFAPLNQGNGTPAKTGMAKISATRSAPGDEVAGDTAPIALVDSVLRDHIVKGIFKLSDLTDGKILTTLNGKQLKVTRSVDTIWVNGIQVGGNQIVSTNNEVVYVVKKVLTGTKITDELQSTSLEITVWDATKWSTVNPKGEMASGAVVVLYRSQKNYADSVSAYEGTATNGKILFKSIAPGTYYIKVSAAGKSNILNRAPQKVNGLYTGFAINGIFQNQAEITAAPTQPGAIVGKFKWADSNADGKIDDSDRVTMPYENTAVTNGSLKKMEISIGQYVISVPQMNEQEFSSMLVEVENNIATWQKKLVIADALLSRQAVIDSIPLAFNTAFQAFGSYTFNPANQQITEIWQQAYNYITVINTLQANAPGGMTKRSEKISRLKATRAYLYLQLLTYFGNIPLIQNTTTLTNTNRASVYNFITTELDAAADSLSLAANGAANLNGLSVKILRAKAALLEKDYAKVAEMTNYVISSAQYSLASLGNQFTAGNAEMIWDNSANIDINVKSFFYNRPSLPYLRLTEVYLMSAEAALALGNTTNAQSRYAFLMQRISSSPGTVTQSAIRALWGNEMRREGVGFSNLLRWETASSSLSTYGFTAAKHSRLPIPQSVLQQNAGLVQNPGY